MNFSCFKKKAAVSAAAALCGIALTFPALPAPKAEASLLGVLVTSGIQYAQLDQAVKYYNNNEEGRKAFFEQLKKNYGVNDDTALNARLTTIMTSLSSAIEEVDPSIKKKPYNYFINKETTFNAFCTLGHNMSVNTGMFNMVANDDEIAVVLGHEMGHGQKDHPAKGFYKSMPINILGEVIADSQGGILGSVGATIFANQATAKTVTKPQEWEADNLAFDYITHSNYNPGACAAIWQRVMEKQSGGEQSSFIGEIFSPNDHPTNEQRRDNYAKKLYEYSNKHVEVKDAKVYVNGNELLTPAPAASMSSAERAFFVGGNLAAAYHNGHDKNTATTSGGTVYLGPQAIMTPVEGDLSANEIVTKLNTAMNSKDKSSNSEKKSD